jgi:hypothetical protein
LARHHDDMAKILCGQKIDGSASFVVAALRHVGDQEHGEDNGQRAVDEEHPPPADQVDQPTADDRSRRARHVERVGILEDVGVSVGGGQSGNDPVAWVNRDVAQLDVGCGDALDGVTTLR